MTALKTIDGYTLDDVARHVVALLKADEEQENETFEGYIPENTVEKYRDIDSYPPFMSAKHVKQLLGISTAFTYELFNSQGFPVQRMGKRMIVAKDSFLKFMKESEGKRIF